MNIDPLLTDLEKMTNTQFGELLEPHRQELQVHCYRMMGTIEDAEDMVQETFFRAWRKRDTYAGRASLRAWLYKIATNACLDALKRASRRSVPQTYEDVSRAANPISPDINDPIWLEPYPDELLPDNNLDPAAVAVEREHVTLAFITVLHLLPPRQRAILLLRDVLNWRAGEVADLLETSVSAVKSALHRARTTLNEHEGGLKVGNGTSYDAIDPAQLEAYVTAWQSADVDGLVKLLTDDAVFSMPPIPSWYRGRPEIHWLLSHHMFAGEGANGRWKLKMTRANQQLAFGIYQIDAARTHYEAYGIQLLTMLDGRVRSIITFRDPTLITKFGLPETL